MEIRIASYVAGSFLLEREPHQWHTIVVLDSGSQVTDFVEKHARTSCIRRFDDVEGPFAGKEPPRRIMIEQCLDFSSGKDKLLVCCRAGQGRSVATAYVIGCREFGVRKAITILNPMRHRPNRLVVQIGATILDNPDILGEFDHWRCRHAHIRLSDYYDEMEAEFEALAAQGAMNRICR